MPRDLPLGNGRLLVAFDSRYQLREFYYPHVGGENHTAGHPSRFGVWCSGVFSWIHSDEWERHLDYMQDTMVTDVKLIGRTVPLTLHIHDAVDYLENVFLRRLRIENTSDSRQEVRLFFHQDFRISGLSAGDTAYYDLEQKAVVHYKGPRTFLITVRGQDGSGLSDYATGIKETEGREGTWRDAEDGELGKSPIAMGPADSVIALKMAIPPKDSVEAWYWICAAETYQEVTELNSRVEQLTPSAMFRRTSDYWLAWVDKDGYEFNDLPDKVVRLYRRSLLTIRTQMDENGAVLAANDSDEIYAYVWPRDGALAAHALDLAGHSFLSMTFYQFVRPLLVREGCFLHKYNSDGSLGSSWHPWIEGEKTRLPIQEDGTALVIWALWKHYDKYRNLEGIRPLYNSLIVRAARFLAGYMDEVHSLPHPSYDLWEQRWGVHAWTVGAVYGGLTAAANFARLFGDIDDAENYEATARTLMEGVDRTLWREEAGRFVRSVIYSPGNKLEIDWIHDISVIGLTLFGMYSPSDTRIMATVKFLEEKLKVDTPIGGLTRFENDTYHLIGSITPQVPGNPWILCTLWIAQNRIATARTEEELHKALPYLEWCVQRALPSGILPEQLDPYTGSPVSVSPLTWSHAAFVETVVEYLDRISDLRICPVCGEPLFTKEREKMRGNRTHIS